MFAAPSVRTAVAVAIFAACTAAPAGAEKTVASVQLDVPAAHDRAAASLDVASYTLDSVADFSLVRVSANSPDAGATRVTLVLPASDDGSTFATSGAGSHFPSLAIRQADASGTTIDRTTFFNVRVTRVERFTSDYGVRRRVTFVARRIAASRGRAPG